MNTISRKIPIITALVWWVLGALILAIWTPEFGWSAAFVGFSLFWLISVFNLFALVQAARSLLPLLNGSEVGRVFPAVFWCSLKLIGFGVLIFLMFRVRAEALMPVILGVSTYGWVPLVGGLWMVIFDSRRTSYA